MMPVHDSLYNGKAYSAAAVLTGAGLINLIEFYPDLFQIIRRYGLAGVKNTDAEPAA